MCFLAESSMEQRSKNMNSKKINQKAKKSLIKHVAYLDYRYYCSSNGEPKHNYFKRQKSLRWS